MFPHLLRDEQIGRAYEIYRAAMAASFYAEKYMGCAVPSDADSWSKIPMLTRQEIFDNAYPRYRRMLTKPLSRMIITSTGGSTGVARHSVLSYEEWEASCNVQSMALHLLGIREDDRVANLFVAGHLWPSFIGVHDALRLVGAVHLPISANISPDEIARMCHEFDPSVMLSLPTLFVLLADLALKEKYEFPSLRLIGYAGEQMSEQAQRHVRHGLKVGEIKALAYSSADAGLMGYQCPQCGFATYHAPTHFQLIEIINTETGQPAKAGEDGELIVTNLARRIMPLIRYRIGDIGTFLPDVCSCGDRNPLFRLAGRAGEDFKLGGAYISLKVFDECLEQVSDLVSLNYNVELEDIANQMDLRLTVEAGDPIKAKDAEPRLRDALCRIVPEIAIGIEKNYIRQFRIRFIELGALPRHPITGKVRKLTDKRVIS